MTELRSNNSGMCHATNLLNTWLMFSTAAFDQDTQPIHEVAETC